MEAEALLTLVWFLIVLVIAVILLLVDILIKVNHMKENMYNLECYICEMNYRTNALYEDILGEER